MTGSDFRGMFKRACTWMEENIKNQVDTMLLLLKPEIEKNKDTIKKEMFMYRYRDSSIGYISSYVAFKLKNELDCEDCKSVCHYKTHKDATTAENKVNYDLVVALSEGKLTYCTEAVHYLVSQAMNILLWCCRHPELQKTIFQTEGDMVEVSKKVLAKVMTDLIMSNKSLDTGLLIVALRMLIKLYSFHISILYLKLIQPGPSTLPQTWSLIISLVT